MINELKRKELIIKLKKDMQRSLSIFGYNLIDIVKWNLSVWTIIHVIEEEISSHCPHGLN